MKEPRNSDLRARTTRFALRVIRVAVSVQKHSVGRVLGTQLLRSGTSVGANYREASRARSKLEFRAKIGDCLTELDESLYWMELLIESGIVQETQIAELRDECDQLLAIFTAIHKRSKE
jgi:four helix bundle protein